MPSVVIFVLVLLALSENVSYIVFSLFSTLYKITPNLQSLSLCHNMLSPDLCDASQVTRQISKEETTHYRTKIWSQTHKCFHVHKEWSATAIALAGVQALAGVHE